MNIIDYAKLLNYLIQEEGLNAVSAYRNVKRIRLLPKEFKEAVLVVIKGGYPSLEVEELSYNEIVEKEQMTPVRAILMLDWYRREPAVAIRYMSSHRYRPIVHELTDEEKETIEATIERLKQKHLQNESIENDTSNIEITD